MNLRYEGPAAPVSLLASMLESEGLTVTYEPPTETKGAGEIAVVVLLYVANKVGDKAIDVSLAAVIEKVVARFKARVADAKIAVDRDSSTDGAE